MKRSPIQRRTPLRAMSAKARGKRAQRRAVREQVIERDGGCVLRGVLEGRDAACGGAIHVHEPKLRSRGGDPLDPLACVALCAVHHRTVHDNPEWAHTVGLMVHSWEDA